MADATGALLGVLQQFFSSAIARTLLAVARRRAQCPEGPVHGASLVALVQALQDSIPSYMADPARRTACAAALQGVVREQGRDPGGEDTGPLPQLVAVRSDADVRVVTDTVKSHAVELGMSVLDQTKLMTAAAELARNILQYARGGEMRFRVLDGRRGLGIEASDQGPGIADLNKVMSPGYRSRTGMGVGLQGTKRLVDAFEIRSAVGQGTVVTVRKYV
jgi:serine/threonine-protein kinase RsbT